MPMSEKRRPRPRTLDFRSSKVPAAMLSLTDSSDGSKYVINYSPDRDVASPPSKYPSQHLRDSMLDDVVPSPLLSITHADSEAFHVEEFARASSVYDSALDSPNSYEDGMADFVGDIAFRSPHAQSPVRTLYTPKSGPLSPAQDRFYKTPISPGLNVSQENLPTISSSVKTTVLPNEMGRNGRRPSLVNPEDYMPGLNVKTGIGKAMAAGFDPVRPQPPVRNLPTIEIVAERLTIPFASKGASLRNSIFVTKSALKSASNDTTDSELDLASTSPITLAAYDQEEVFGRDAEETVIMPTLYSNTYLGTATVPLRSPAANKGGGPLDSPNAMLRDPNTGKIDNSSGNLNGNTLRTIDVINTPFDSPVTEKSLDGNFHISDTAFNEKHAPSEYKSYFSAADSAASLVKSKPTPQIIQLPGTEYSMISKTLLAFSPVTFIISTAATVFYLFVRGDYISRAHRATGNTFVAAWLFFASEALFALWIFGHSIGQILSINLQPKPRYALKGNLSLPTVDVMVVCSGQDNSIVMDATVAAARLDWPVDRMRVLVVDETASDSLKRSVEYYANNRALHVTYHRRNKNFLNNKGIWYKSSSINFGLAETRAEGRISGEYVVVFDAESIPEPEFLRETLPHLIRDPVVALAQTRCGYYNLPKKLDMSFGTFMRCVEPSTDIHSGFVLRRSAIDDIGGFPTHSSVEDRRLHSCLQGRGYKTLWTDDNVHFSMIPDSFSTHLRQRVERQLAHIGTAARLGFFLFNKRIQYMPVRSRLAGVGRAIAPFLSILILLNMVAYPIALIYGGFLVPALSIAELNLMIWAALAAILTERLHDFFFSMPTGEASARRFIQAQVFMAPYTVMGLIRGLVPPFMRRAQQPYWTDGEIRSASERDPKCRKGFFERLLSVTFISHGWIHALIFSLILGAIGYSLHKSIMPYVWHQRTLHQTGLLILMTVAWPTLPWVNVLLGSLVPFLYAVFPPSVPDRERQLHREPISGVARPLPYAKRIRPFRQGFFGQLILSVLLVGYACVIFALTFIKVHVD